MSFNFLTILEHQAIIIFFSTFFFGDEMVYLFGFLSGTEVFNLWLVIIFSILGNGGCDIFWLSVARSKYAAKAKKWLFSRKKVKHINFGKKKLFMSIFLSKFFYGTRLITIFYVAEKEKNFGKIIFFNTLAVILWVFIVSISMFYMGKFTRISLDFIKDIRWYLSIGVISVIIIYIINRFYGSKLFYRVSSFYEKYLKAA